MTLDVPNTDNQMKKDVCFKKLVTILILKHSLQFRIVYKNVSAFSVTLKTKSH